MTPGLCQIAIPTPSSEHLWVIIWAAFAAAAAVVMVRKISPPEHGEKRAIGPQPFEVTPAKKYVEKEELTKVNAEMTTRFAMIEAQLQVIRSDMNNNRDRVDSATEGRFARLDDKIDKVRCDLETKLESMPDRIVAILRHTGALRE